MDFTLSQDLEDIRAGVRELCDGFGVGYWRGLEPDRYPLEFVRALTEHGWLAALIPERYGGAGLKLDAASVILEEICASGGNAAACHAQLYVMGTLLRHGSEAQRERWLPGIASGELRLQAFGVTEPGAGSDTTAIQTRAQRTAGGLPRQRSEGLDLARGALRSDGPARAHDAGRGARAAHRRPVAVPGRHARARRRARDPPDRTMINHATTEVFFNDLELPADALIGEEGNGFRYVLDGMNAERILIAAECVGDGRFFVERAARYAGERVVFGRPIGANQGVQFPIARAHMAIEAANLMRWKACSAYMAEQPCGAEANMAKFLASEASWQAANACLDTHGGFGFALDYDIERKFRETRLYTIAPVSNNLVLAYVGEHVLGMPRSY